MSPSPPSPFPTIDISPFLQPTNSSPTLLQETARSLSTACTHPGFFYLTHHNIPSALADQILSLARDFFLTAPSHEKESLKRRDVGVECGDGARGYQVVGDNITQGKRDWHEALDWYRPVRDGEPFITAIGTDDQANGYGATEERSPPFALLQGLNRWPTHPSSFRSTYEEYIRLMLELGTAVVRAMGMALGGGMEDVFVGNTRRSWWVMRAIGYPPLPDGQGGVDGNGKDGDEGGVSCGVHSDYGCVTLLLMDETRGALQAWVEDDADGVGHSGNGGEKNGRWVNVDPVPGALVVNIGDMMERWSGGKWKATRHRVVHRSDGYRVSVPFFFEPDWNAKVPGLPGEGEVVYGEYLERKVRGNF